MTPPLPLAELVQKWEERSRKCYADGEYTAEYHLDRCIDELAALPLGRCETCRYQVKQDRMCQILLFAAGVEARRMSHQGHVIERPGDPRFSCSAYEQRLPAPPAAGEETR